MGIVFISQNQSPGDPTLTCVLWSYPTSAASQQPCLYLTGAWTGAGAGISTATLGTAVTCTGSMLLMLGIAAQGVTATHVNSVSAPVVAWTYLTGIHNASYSTEWWQLALTASVTSMQVAVTMSAATNIGFSVIGITSGSTTGTLIGNVQYAGATATLTWAAATSGSQLLASVWTAGSTQPSLSGCTNIYSVNNAVNQVRGTNLASAGSNSYSLAEGASTAWNYTGVEMVGPVQ